MYLILERTLLGVQTLTGPFKDWFPQKPMCVYIHQGGGSHRCDQNVDL